MGGRRYLSIQNFRFTDTSGSGCFPRIHIDNQATGSRQRSAVDLAFHHPGPDRFPLILKHEASTKRRFLHRRLSSAAHFFSTCWSQEDTQEIHNPHNTPFRQPIYSYLNMVQLTVVTFTVLIQLALMTQSSVGLPIQ
jgi:hypothetical protein